MYPLYWVVGRGPSQPGSDVTMCSGMSERAGWYVRTPSSKNAKWTSISECAVTGNTIIDVPLAGLIRWEWS